MPNLNDFYTFNSTSSERASGKGKFHRNSGGTDYCTALIILSILGWSLWLIGKMSR